VALLLFLDRIVADGVRRAQSLLDVAFFEILPGMPRPDPGIEIRL